MLEDGIKRESVALHLHITHDETSRHIAICNDNYKFTTYPYSFLYKFTVDNEVIVMIYFETFLQEP